MSQTAESTSPGRTAQDKPIIRAQGLRKTFRMGDAALVVLKNADISIRPGEFVAIEGRSGSGKSTLLHLLGGLDTPDAGSLHFFDRDYTRLPHRKEEKFKRAMMSPAWWYASIALWLAFGAQTLAAFIAPRYAPPASRWALGILSCIAIAGALTGLFLRIQRFLRDDRIAAPLRNKEFGFVFQFYHLLPELNVLENTMLAPMIERSWFNFKANRRSLRDRAKSILTELGLEHRLKHKPAQLSGGERQRVAIARALMNEPVVLFADEPTGNLDFETGLQIMAVLEKLHREKGQTIVMVTHDRTIARMADRVLVLKEGRLERPSDPPGAKAISALDYQ
jgi:ABC-type lipoprotein export system ATPase subunit